MGTCRKPMAVYDGQRGNKSFRRAVDGAVTDVPVTHATCVASAVPDTGRMPESRSHGARGSGHRLLAAYSAMLTAALMAVLLTGASGTGRAVFEELDVQRLDLREPDGTRRYVLSSSARMPGAILRGQEYPHPRRQAGMLFYNDEETELGGLLFGGRSNWRGAVRASGGSLTFDRYEQDQVVRIAGFERDGRIRAGMDVFDRPQRSVVEDFQEQPELRAMRRSERRALVRQRAADSYYGAGRVFVGRGYDGDAALRLQDAAGHTRLRLRVAESGEAAIEFMDAEGRVTHRLAPGSRVRDP